MRWADSEDIEDRSLNIYLLSHLQKSLYVQPQR